METEPIRRRTQRAFLKSRDSTKMFRRSDFRNARSVRKGIHQTKKAALSVLPIKRIGNSDYTFLAEFEGNPVAGIWGEHPIDKVRQLTHFY